MNEVLTIEEIRLRFDAEWILVEDSELTDELEVVGGKVLYHSADRDEVYQKGVELRPMHSAYLYYWPNAGEHGYHAVSVFFDPTTDLTVVTAHIFGPTSNTVIRMALDTGAVGTVIHLKILVALGCDLS
jgi:hypothetical protein